MAEGSLTDRRQSVPPGPRPGALLSERTTERLLNAERTIAGRHHGRPRYLGRAG